MDNWLVGADDSKWTETNAPGIGGLQGRKSGFPSSRQPVNLLQTGFVAKSGRLFPTLTTIVAGLFLPADNYKQYYKHLQHYTQREPYREG